MPTLHAERRMRCKIVYFTRQRFARAIIDAETSRRLFMNITRIEYFSYSLMHLSIALNRLLSVITHTHVKTNIFFFIFLFFILFYFATQRRIE